MKCIFQLVKSSDGNRTEGVEAERTEFANAMFDKNGEMYPGIEFSDYVLVLAEQHGETWVPSKAPLMTVGRFVESFCTVVNFQSVGVASNG